jgi:choline dehydrogenase-like flavoprotein
MLHRIRTRASAKPVLSTRERAILAAVAEAALPAGRVFPAAGEAAIARLEDGLRALPSSAQTAYKALIWGLDSAARVQTLRPLARLGPDARLNLLEAWRSGSLPRRLALRALLTPLKAAHFDNPAFFREIGCVYEFDAAGAEERPRHVRERSHGPEVLADGDLELECDVVVLGTGAGGAVVAKELAEAGHAVVMVEEGSFFGRQDFGGRPLAMQKKLYRDMGATFSVGNAGIPIPVGKTVGGSTTINSGTCYRVPDRVLARWRDEFGLAELGPGSLDPYYERVEAVLGVAPAPAEHLGGAARVVAQGCEQLGYRRHKPLLRNAPACDGQGVCCFGCPTDAKRSTNVSYVPLAMRAGAELFYGARAERILVEGGRAAGVRASVATEAGPRALTLRARAVVVACGALMTPVLLQENGLCGRSGELGKNLTIHPAMGSLAVFDEEISGYNAIPQGYAIEEFHDEGLLFEGASTPLDLTMTAMPYIGPQLIELAESFDRVAMFGLMIEDSSRGRVRAARGRPLITYRLNERDVARLKHGVEILARIFFAAGARAVHPLVHGFDVLQSEAELTRFREARISASDLELSAYHPLGTARMGLDPARSVVDPSHRAHDVPGLYITDGASVPTSLAVNPQVTIMAMATRAAAYISSDLA